MPESSGRFGIDPERNLPGLMCSFGIGLTFVPCLVIARSETTKQSITSLLFEMDCFAGARNDVVETFVYPTGKSMRVALDGLSSPFNKNILIFRNIESAYIHRHPAPTRGALRGRHGRWVRDAVDAGSAFDEWCDSGRRSRVVLTPRRWCQVSWKYPRGDGGKRARSPGRARNKPLKPLRGESRMFPVNSW